MTAAAMIRHTIDLKSAQIRQELMMVSMMDRSMTTEEEMILLNVSIKLEEVRQFSRKIGSDGKITSSEKLELIKKIEEIFSGSVEVAQSERGISSDEREILRLLKIHVMELRQVIHSIEINN